MLSTKQEQEEQRGARRSNEEHGGARRSTEGHEGGGSSGGVLGAERLRELEEGVHVGLVVLRPVQLEVRDVDRPVKVQRHLPGVGGP